MTAEHQTKYRALLTMGFWAQDTHCDPQGRGHKQREGLHSGLAHCQPPSLLIPCKPWPGTQRLLTSALSPGAPFAAQPVMLPPIQGTQPPTPLPPGPASLSPSPCISPEVPGGHCILRGIFHQGAPTPSPKGPCSQAWPHPPVPPAALCACSGSPAGQGPVPWGHQARDRVRYQHRHRSAP